MLLASVMNGLVNYLEKYHCFIQIENCAIIDRYNNGLLTLVTVKR